jgi:phosphoribosylformylglycinamidine cyclo-ligase
LSSAQIREPALTIWRHHSRTGSLSALSIGYGLLFAVVCTAAGIPGVLLLVLPVLFARYALRLYADLRQDHVSFVRALSLALDAVDPYTHEHSVRVAEYSVRVARRMGLPESEVETIRYAALVHDIGKIAQRPDVIRKPDTLDEEERRLMMRHPEAGPDHRPGRALGDAARMVRTHWRPDARLSTRTHGSRRAGGARVIRLRRVDAMVSDRRTEGAFSRGARWELKRHAGTQFDAEIVVVLVGPTTGTSRVRQGCRNEDLSEGRPTRPTASRPSPERSSDERGEAGANFKKEEAVERIKARSAPRSCPAWSATGPSRGLRLPGGDGQILLSSIDGVGTKLKVAILCDRHDTVGYDLVCHSANDILVHGGRPLFFLDYVAMGVLEPARVEQLVAGLARGCREVGCALIGGETAEMPGLYREGDYDLAGAIVGIVQESKLVDGSRVAPGDALLGLPSVGLHTNGYSLARTILFDRLKLRAQDPMPGGGGTVGDVLLSPHPWYGREVATAREAGDVRAMAHITGGGLPGNLIRVLPPGARAEIRTGSWPVPAVFRALVDAGGVAADEAHRVWNMGIGFVLVGSVRTRVAGALRAQGHGCTGSARSAGAGLAPSAGGSGMPVDVELERAKSVRAEGNRARWPTSCRAARPYLETLGLAGWSRRHRSRPAHRRSAPSPRRSSSTARQAPERADRALSTAWSRVPSVRSCRNFAAIPDLWLKRAFGHARCIHRRTPTVPAFRAGAHGGTLPDEIGDRGASAEPPPSRAQEGGLRRVGTAAEGGLSGSSPRRIATSRPTRAPGASAPISTTARAHLARPRARGGSTTPVLAAHILRRLCDDGRPECFRITDAALARLAAHLWPGNVRELGATLERAVHALEPRGTLTTASLGDGLGLGPEPVLRERPEGLRGRTLELEAELIHDAIERAHGNKTVAARSLGLSRQGLWKKMRRLARRGAAEPPRERESL